MQRGWTPELRKYVKKLAEGQEAQIPPSNTMLDSIFLSPAMLGMTKDKEEVSMHVRIGQKCVREPLILKTPVFLSPMPNIPHDAIGTLEEAATAAGTILHTCNPRAPLKRGALWDPSRMHILDLQDADFVVFVLTGTISPKKHPDIDTPKDIRKHIELLREATDYRIPIIVEISSRDIYTDIALLLEADAVLLHDPPEGINGLPSIVQMRAAVRAFVDGMAKQKGVKLMVSGDFRTPLDIFKVLALGADCVGVTGAVHVLCDIAERKKLHNTAFNYLQGCTRALANLIKYTGHTSVSEVSDEDIRALTYDTAAITGIKLAGYEKVLPMWMH